MNIAKDDGLLDLVQGKREDQKAEEPEIIFSPTTQSPRGASEIEINTNLIETDERSAETINEGLVG